MMVRSTKPRIPEREIYKRRIQNLLDNPPSAKIEGSGVLELDAHWAKYACVLVSGYMEKSIQEILHGYCSGKSEQRIGHYIEKSWPKSANMNTRNIIDIVGKFDANWESELATWIGKGEGSNGSVINAIVTTRNNIAHGSESRTNGVTINSVCQQFETAKALISKLESMVFSA